MMVVTHFEIVKTIFGISSRIDGAELSMKDLNKSGPIGQPVGASVRVHKCWFKIIKCKTMKIR